MCEFQVPSLFAEYREGAPEFNPRRHMTVMRDNLLQELVRFFDSPIVREPGLRLHSFHYLALAHGE